jgi:hypothetical protein
MEKLEHLYLEGNNELNITINSQLFANIPKIRVFRTAFHKSIQLELSDDLLLHNNDLKNLSIANWGTDGCQSNGNLSENIFKNQEKIEYLLIKGCDIEGQIHQNLFKYNTELINLNLSQNKLSGAIPANLFQNNTKIKRIALENNELSGSIPAGLFEETSELSELSLASNKLSGTIPSQLFQPLKNIKKLSVSYNELSGFAPLDTTVLKEEVTLAFHTNKFTSDQLDSYLVNFNQAITSCAASSGGNSFFPWMLANNGITMENQDPLASITNLSAKQELIDKGCEVHHD